MRATRTAGQQSAYLRSSPGLLLGTLSIKGIHLGSSGVLFGALLAAFGVLAACRRWPTGPGPVRLLRRHRRRQPLLCLGRARGATLGKLAVVIVGTGAALTYVGAKLLDLPRDLPVESLPAHSPAHLPWLPPARGSRATAPVSVLATALPMHVGSSASSFCASAAETAQA